MDAAVTEFSSMPYEQVKLSRIIKTAGIPRGSFYQYFLNKEDLFKHLFEIIKNSKMEFMKDLLPNPEDTPFLILFRELYERGLRFALKYPEYIKVTKHLFDSRGPIYNELVGDGLQLAKEYYISYVETDKRLGRISDIVDSELLANLLIQATTQIAFDEIVGNEELNEQRLLRKVDGLITILQKGIE